MSDPLCTPEKVSQILQGLIAGSVSRQDASEWATGWFAIDQRVDDATVWDAVTLLGAADLPGFDKPYLYTEEDYYACLDQLRQRTEQKS